MILIPTLVIAVLLTLVFAAFVYILFQRRELQYHKDCILHLAETLDYMGNVLGPIVSQYEPERHAAVARLLESTGAVVSELNSYR